MLSGEGAPSADEEGSIPHHPDLLGGGTLYIHPGAFLEVEDPQQALEALRRMDALFWFPEDGDLAVDVLLHDPAPLELFLR